jgi:hypothetical protein
MIFNPDKLNPVQSSPVLQMVVNGSFTNAGPYSFVFWVNPSWAQRVRVSSDIKLRPRDSTLSTLPSSKSSKAFSVQKSCTTVSCSPSKALA